MSSVPSYVLSGEHDPRQWSKWRRWAIAFVIWHSIAPVDLAVTFYSGIQQQIQDDFHTTESIVTLGVGLYNFGATFGPLIASPLSEIYGRRPVYVTSMVGFTILSLCTALSPSVFILLGCRTLGGLIGSGVFSLYGGSLSDMFNPLERAPLVALFTIMLQGAPTFGPVPASLLGAFVPWRWLMGFITVWAALLAGLLVLLPETEPSAIQKKLAKQHGMPVIPTRGSSKDMSNMWREALFTPITMLLQEPIVSWTTLYHAFVYGLLFLLLEAYPHVFAALYGMSRQETGLVFLAPWIGNLLGVLFYFVSLKPHLRARRNQIFCESSGKRQISPEERLPGVVIGSLFTPIGMLWFALTARPDIPRLVPILSGIPVGIGMTLMQLSLLNYYIDLYPTRSASVVAANCAVRNLTATVFPSVAVPLYRALGIRGASLALACVSCIGFPMALILLAHGKRLRVQSRWAVQDAVGVPGPVAPLLGQYVVQGYGGTVTSSRTS
ncbi:major facilitator superfamily domain-containing protein [Boletus reticuloceps]|uniref:Major facilitator superfamily domain-containing protein n=1 Tax=Boletus reticuloceps TaxID=495285 RepID=A0A8I2YJK7_9AGAM|nr:major facilitator superfamily domain-containing protein [Boletus reticuloceps]